MTKKMEWPSSLADGDALIVREDTPDGLWFVVYSRREPQFKCSTYREAETRTLAYAEHARVHVWYANGRSGLQLVGKLPRPASSPVRRQDGVAPALSTPSR